MKRFVHFLKSNLEQSFAESDFDRREVAVSCQLITIPLRVQQHVELVRHLWQQVVETISISVEIFHLIELTSDVVFCLIDIQRGNVFVRLLARGDCQVASERQDEETVPCLIRAVEDETGSRARKLQRREARG